ncbi:hypothetical protein SOVF_045780 [Spinacia oleracea]|nr:hypothetical protein SOVF_045780 [Spinacia oleracea]
MEARPSSSLSTSSVFARWKPTGDVDPMHWVACVALGVSQKSDLGSVPGRFPTVVFRELFFFRNRFGIWALVIPEMVSV